MLKKIEFYVTLFLELGTIIMSGLMKGKQSFYQKMDESLEQVHSELKERLDKIEEA